MNFPTCTLSIFLVTVAASARADVTYTFQGPHFTEHSGIYKVTDSLSGTFTLSAPVLADMDARSYTPLSFSFTSGEDTIDTPDPFDSFVISTDGSGAILQYSFEVLSPGRVLYEITSGGNEFGEEDTVVNLVTHDIGDVYGPGTLTVATVTPEPASLLLLGTGVVGLMGAVRRGRRSLA